jgi:hypothetical protein
MTSRSSACVLVLAALLAATTAQPCFGISGTMRIASLGKPTAGKASWPTKVTEFVNLPARTTGWYSWFSETPSDVQRYWFHVENVTELNALIEQFAAIESKKLEIVLSPEQNPSGGLEFHGESVEFSIGDQQTLDRWFEQLEVDADGRRIFGVHRYDKPPVALPPTLTIFLKHKVVNVDELRLPPGISVRRLAPQRPLGGEIITIF